MRLSEAEGKGGRVESEKVMKWIECLRERMAAVGDERDRLISCIDEMEGLRDCCDEAYDSLQRAVDALSELA